MQRVLILPVVMLIVSCSTPLPAPQIAPPERALVEITDLFQAGQQRVLESLGSDTALAEVWESRRNHVVLVLTEIQWDDGEREQAQQSGIIVAGGRLVLTAGHGFVIDDGEVLEIRVRISTGREFRMRLLAWEHDEEARPVHDWALLEPGQVLPYSEIRPKSASADREQLLLLGYPGALGTDPEGEVVRILEMTSGSFQPLGMICSPSPMNRHSLFPRAGTIPQQGISGAPVFASNGELVGLFSSIGRRRTIAGWHYVFGMADIPRDEIEVRSSK